jgi:hypothetical protein
MSYSPPPHFAAEKVDVTVEFPTVEFPINTGVHKVDLGAGRSSRRSSHLNSLKQLLTDSSADNT